MVPLSLYQVPLARSPEPSTSEPTVAADSVEPSGRLQAKVGKTRSPWARLTRHYQLGGHPPRTPCRMGPSNGSSSEPGAWRAPRRQGHLSQGLREGTIPEELPQTTHLVGVFVGLLLFLISAEDEGSVWPIQGWLIGSQKVGTGPWRHIARSLQPSGSVTWRGRPWRWR